MYNSENDQTREIDTSVSARKRSVIAGEEIVLDEERDAVENEETDKVANEKTKKPANKKLVIGLVCLFAVILSIVVYTLVTKDGNKNENSNNLNNESNLLVDEKYYYEGLNYTVTKEYIHQIGFFYDYSRNLEGKKIDVSYSKVEGLKDKSLQDKINKLLEKTATDMYVPENVQDNTVLYDHIYNCTDVYIFNNVLSTIFCKEFCDVEGNVSYEYKSVNINLKAFEPFNFADIFTSTTDTSTLIPQDAKMKYDSENFAFAISPKLIYIPLDDGKFKYINLYENKDKVAIYKRYATDEKMFDATFKAAPYAFTTKKFLEADSYGLVEDNLFIDTNNMTIGTDFSEELKTAARNEYNNVINQVKNISYSNPSKRYLAQITTNIEKDKYDEKLYNVTVDYEIYEIEKEFFNQNIVKFVVASENKINQDYVSPKYFTNTAMDAEVYLKNTQSDTVIKKLNEKGEEPKVEDNKEDKNMYITIS